MGSRLVVVGDALLDVDLIGRAERLCSDAPAPVVDVTDELVRPGGAGLAARLAAADGVDVRLVPAIADDEDGRRLRRALAGVPTVAGAAASATPVKARVRSAGRSVTRFDRGGRGAGPVDVTDEMLAAVRGADAVLVSDYGRGLAADERLRAVLVETARRRPVVWDPHPRGPRPVPGVWLATPNLAEARAAAGIDGVDVASASRAASRLRLDWRCRAVVVTLGERGALLDRADGVPMVVPAVPIASTDPCGAGDRFAATVATSLMRGVTTDEAVAAAVLSAAGFLAAGGVSAVGTGGAARAADLAPDAGQFGGRCGVASARLLIDRTRAAGGTVVATGGCFDLLHTGHLRTLRSARSLGDCLIVCLNSDRSVRRLKGASRPINHEADRAELVASVRCVDAVVLFDADTPAELLDELRPDIWVKGGDYSPDTLSETDLVRGWGGSVVVVPYHAGRSTTRLAATVAAIG